MDMQIPYKKTKNGITIEVKVEPRSSKRQITGIMDGTILKVKLTAPPVDGSANEQLIELIAEADRGEEVLDKDRQGSVVKEKTC